jgi:glycosyltransferase involved in cell wall biosynthesis
MMRICLFSNFFFPRVGGIEQSSHNLAQGLTQLGHEVVVVTATPRGEHPDAAAPYPIVRPPLVAFWRESLPEFDLLVSNGMSLRHLRQWRRSGVPFGWIHNMSLGNTSTLRQAARFKLRRLATRLAHFNICVSEYMKQNVANRNAVVIPNAVAPRFRPIDGVVPSNRFLFYGRMWAPKGMEVLLRAIAHARDQGVDLPTDFIGDGEAAADMRNLGAELRLGPLARFRPFLQGDDLVRAICESKGVVIPSLCDEAFPLVAIEAMACGRCVVGSRIGGLTESVRDVGVLVAPGNVPELAATLIDLSHNPEKLALHEARSLAAAGRYRNEPICREYLEVFKRHVRKSVSPAGRHP